MAHNKPAGLKMRLAYEMRKNRLAPAWVLIKKFGIGRARHISIWRIKRKRHWRRRAGVNKKLKV